MAENKKIEYLSAEQLFGKLSELRGYLRGVNGVLVGSNVGSVQILEDLKKILNAKTVKDLDKFLNKEINSVTIREIGAYKENRIVVSVAKLTALLRQIEKAHLEQSNLSIEQLRDLCKKQEIAMLKQYQQSEDQKRKLNEQITELLELLKKTMWRASEKAGLLRSKFKNNLKNAADNIATIIRWRDNSMQNGSEPDPVNVARLEDVSYGEKITDYYQR